MEPLHVASRFWVFWTLPCVLQPILALTCSVLALVFSLQAPVLPIYSRNHHLNCRFLRQNWPNCIGFSYLLGSSELHNIEFGATRHLGYGLGDLFMGRSPMLNLFFFSFCSGLFLIRWVHLLVSGNCYSFVYSALSVLVPPIPFVVDFWHWSRAGIILICLLGRSAVVKNWLPNKMSSISQVSPS